MFSNFRYVHILPLKSNVCLASCKELNLKMADFWSFAIVVGLLWYVVVPSCYIWREGTWHTPGNHPSSASRWLHTSSLAANLRRSRRHTLLFPIDRDSLYNRPTHLLSALLHPQEFRGDMTQYPSVTRFHSDIVRW